MLFRRPGWLGTAGVHELDRPAAGGLGAVSDRPGFVSAAASHGLRFTSTGVAPPVRRWRSNEDRQAISFMANFPGGTWLHGGAGERRHRVPRGPQSWGETGIQLWRDGKALTTPLFDHPGVVVGLRYVEVFHLAHAVVLGWSPNTGRFLATDVQHEDSAESGDVGLEYAISALTLAYAATANRDLAQAKIVDPDLAAQIAALAAPQVPQFTQADWQRAASEGIDAWRQLIAGTGQRVELDFVSHQLGVHA